MCKGHQPVLTVYVHTRYKHQNQRSHSQDYKEQNWCRLDLIRRHFFWERVVSKQVRIGLFINGAEKQIVTKRRSHAARNKCVLSARRNWPRLRSGWRSCRLFQSLWPAAANEQGAQVRITQCYLQITPYLPLPRKRSPDGASPDWGYRHLVAAYYSLIYPKGRKTESAWLADLQRTVYPHKWSPISCRSSAGQ